MDHIDKALASASDSPFKFAVAIRAALAIGKSAMNRYYDKTDQSEVYRIAMGKSTLRFIDDIHSLLLFYQFSTLVISLNTSKLRNGTTNGSKLHATLFVKNLTARTRR
jgi:hypothetical protein